MRTIKMDRLYGQPDVEDTAHGFWKKANPPSHVMKGVEHFLNE